MLWNFFQSSFSCVVWGLLHEVHSLAHGRGLDIYNQPAHVSRDADAGSDLYFVNVDRLHFQDVHLEDGELDDDDLVAGALRSLASGGLEFLAIQQ